MAPQNLQSILVTHVLKIWINVIDLYILYCQESLIYLTANHCRFKVKAHDLVLNIIHKEMHQLVCFI